MFLWDPVRGACLKQTDGHGAAVRFMRVSADNTSVLTGSGDRKVSGWPPGQEAGGLTAGRGGAGRGIKEAGGITWAGEQCAHVAGRVVVGFAGGGGGSGHTALLGVMGGLG